MRNCRLCKMTNFGIRHLVFFVQFLVLTSAKHLWYNKTTRARVDNYSTAARICQAFFQKTCHASQIFVKTQNAWLFLLFCNYYNSFASFCQLLSNKFLPNKLNMINVRIMFANLLLRKVRFRHFHLLH